MNKTLTRAEIVEAVYVQLRSKSSYKRSKLKFIVEKFFDLISEALAEGEEVLISGFGKFECLEKAPRVGRNPKTEEPLLLPARRAIVFRPSKKFRQELNGNSEDD